MKYSQYFQFIFAACLSVAMVASAAPMENGEPSSSSHQRQRKQETVKSSTSSNHDHLNPYRNDYPPTVANPQAMPGFQSAGYPYHWGGFVGESTHWNAAAPQYGPYDPQQFPPGTHPFVAASSTRPYHNPNYYPTEPNLMVMPGFQSASHMGPQSSQNPGRQPTEDSPAMPGLHHRFHMGQNSVQSTGHHIPPMYGRSQEDSDARARQSQLQMQRDANEAARRLASQSYQTGRLPEPQELGLPSSLSRKTPRRTYGGVIQSSYATNMGDRRNYASGDEDSPPLDGRRQRETRENGSSPYGPGNN